MAILVLGGAGFIGRHIISALLEGGERVVCYDKIGLCVEHRNLQVLKGDITDTLAIEDAISLYAVNRVVHLVSTTLPQSSNRDPVLDLESNVIPALRIIELCIKHQVQKLVFMSSGGTVYGDPHQLPVEEQHPTDPICAYGIHKLAIEKYIKLAHSLYGLGYVIIRAANPIGPGQSPVAPQGVVPTFVRNLSSNEPIVLWGDGSTVRDYFDVRDLAVLTLLAVNSERSGTYNAGSGMGTSLDQILQVVSQKLNIEPEIIIRKRRPSDVEKVFLDISKATTELNWTPQINLERSVSDYIEWYAEQYKPQ